jgi:hypothetical protein
MTSVSKKLPSRALLTLEHAMCNLKVKASLIDLPAEILIQLFSYIAPCHEDGIGKNAHNYVLELLCVHSTLKTIGIHYLWAYRVAAIDYHTGNYNRSTICQHQSEFKLCPDTPQGVELNSFVKGLCCRWGNHCSKSVNAFDELQGSCLFPLVSRFDNLTELVLQIPVSTTALGLILQACHLNLQKLDYKSENRERGSSALPPLPQLSQLTIRYHHANNDHTAHNLKCTSDIFSFIEAVSTNLREMVLFGPSLEPDVTTALISLSGLRSLHLVEPTYSLHFSPSNEHVEPFSQASQLKALSIPLSWWNAFPQGYFESLQVVTLKLIDYRDRAPKNPHFTMALRSVSVHFHLDFSSLEDLGALPSLERLEMNLNYQVQQHFAHAGVFNPHAFLQLKSLTIHQYYFDYMQNFELLKLTHFNLSGLVCNLGLNVDFPEIPWRHQLLSFSVTFDGQVVWNSKASFSKLLELNLNFYVDEYPVLCQFPALRTLKILSIRLPKKFNIIPTKWIIPSRFPKLRTLEVENFMGFPFSIPLKYFSATHISSDILNTLMKYNEVDTVQFQSLTQSRSEVLELYWHGTPSSIRLWKQIPSIQLHAAGNDIHIIFLSSDFDKEVILPVVLWYMKRRHVHAPRKRQAKGINYDYAKAIISLIIEEDTLEESTAFKALVEGIRGFHIYCKINIIASPKSDDSVVFPGQ